MAGEPGKGLVLRMGWGQFFRLGKVLSLCRKTAGRGGREVQAGSRGLVSTLGHAGKETWVWKLWLRRLWATWWTCAIGRVARLALGGVHRATPQPERKPVSTAARGLAASLAVPGWEAHLCQSVTWGTGRGLLPAAEGPGRPFTRQGQVLMARPGSGPKLGRGLSSGGALLPPQWGQR